MDKVYELVWGDTFEAIVYLLVLASITIIIEAPVVFIGLKKSVYEHKIGLLVIVNVFTNVILNTIISFYQMDIEIEVLIMEIVIVLVEALIYYLAVFDISRKRAFLVSLIANALSFVLGSFIALYFELYDDIMRLVVYYRY